MLRNWPVNHGSILLMHSFLMKCQGTNVFYRVAQLYVKIGVIESHVVAIAVAEVALHNIEVVEEVMD